VTSAVPGDELRDRLIEAAAHALVMAYPGRPEHRHQEAGTAVDAVLPLVRAELAAAEQERDQAIALLRQVRDHMDEHVIRCERFQEIRGDIDQSDLLDTAPTRGKQDT
jgi:hypothetical protein